MRKNLINFSIFVLDFSDHEKKPNHKIRKDFLSSPRILGNNNLKLQIAAQHTKLAAAYIVDQSTVTNVGACFKAFSFV